jgi:hypothetical protein
METFESLTSLSTSLVVLSEQEEVSGALISLDKTLELQKHKDTVYVDD